MPRPFRNDPEHFWRRVDKTGECWVWTGARYPGGYGIISYQRQRWQTHRLAFALTYGEIPAGMFVCHRCDNPPCCRPDHLFLGTQKDNARDRALKGRGHQPAGEDRHNARLTAAQVRQIRDEYRAGDVTGRALAARYGVGPSTITTILSNQTWRTADAGMTETMPGRYAGFKLKASDVEEIRRLYANGGVRQRDLAERFGVCQMTISHVVRGKTWVRRSRGLAPRKGLVGQ